MSTGVRYLCDGFYPVEADNVVHAGLLFALQIARQKHGPTARCNKLALRGSIGPEGATFEAAAGVPPNSESYQFTVLIDPQQGGLARGIIRRSTYSQLGRSDL
jgi:hypothetical protein